MTTGKDGSVNEEHKIGNFEHGFIPHENKVEHILKSQAMRDLAERVESAVIVEKDDDFMPFRPSLIYALFEQIRNLQGQIDFAENQITRLRTILLNIRNEAEKMNQ